MSKYRIIKIHGEYRVQECYLWFFWLTHEDEDDYPISFRNTEQAKEYIVCHEQNEKMEVIEYL